MDHFEILCSVLDCIEDYAATNGIGGLNKATQETRELLRQEALGSVPVTAERRLRRSNVVQLDAYRPMAQVGR